MEKYLTEIAACLLWAPVIGMIVYGAFAPHNKMPRLTRALLLICCMLIGCVLCVYLAHFLE